jgi:hypothetical protein
MLIIKKSSQGSADFCFLVKRAGCPYNTKWHSIEIECLTPKFLKNRETLTFQKLAGGRISAALPSRFKFKAILKRLGYDNSSLTI